MHQNVQHWLKSKFWKKCRILFCKMSLTSSIWANFCSTCISMISISFENLFILLVIGCSIVHTNFVRSTLIDQLVIFCTKYFGIVFQICICSFDPFRIKPRKPADDVPRTVPCPHKVILIKTGEYRIQGYMGAQSTNAHAHIHFCCVRREYLVFSPLTNVPLLYIWNVWGKVFHKDGQE